MCWSSSCVSFLLCIVACLLLVLLLRALLSSASCCGSSSARCSSWLGCCVLRALSALLVLASVLSALLVAGVGAACLRPVCPLSSALAGSSGRFVPPWFVAPAALSCGFGSSCPLPLCEEVDTMKNKKHTYDRASYLSFRLYTHAMYGTPDPFELNPRQRDKAFCKYQCQCARMGVSYEHPARYGVKGLFG